MKVNLRSFGPRLAVSTIYLSFTYHNFFHWYHEDIRMWELELKILEQTNSKELDKTKSSAHISTSRI